MKKYGQDSIFSWIVAVSCLWIYSVIYGLVRLSGILLVASMPRYGVGREAASFPYTLINFTKHLTGPLFGLLAKRYGVRKVIISGTLLAAIGVGVCFVAENIFTVAVLWGILFGAGSAACVSLLPVLINHNFDKYRSIASGISKAGVPVGSFIIPPITDALLNRYEISGTFLILSGFVLNCLPAALLLKCPNYSAQNMKLTIKKPFYDGEKHRLISKEKSALYTNDNHNRVLSSNKMTPNSKFEKSPQNENKAFNNTLTSRVFSDSQGLQKSRDCPLIMSWPSSNHAFIDTGDRPVFGYSLDACRNYDLTPNQVPRRNIASGATDIPTETRVGIKSEETEKLPILRLETYRENQVVWKDVSENFEKSKLKVTTHEGQTASVCKVNVHSTSGKSTNLLCDPLFMIVVFVTAFTAFIGTCMFSIIVDFSKDIGIAAEYGKYTVMAISGGEILGNVIIGLMTDGRCARNTMFVTLCCLAQAIAIVVVAQSTEFYMLICTLAVFGCIHAGFAVIVPLVLGDFIETEKQMLAIASNSLLGGPVSLAISPMIGYFRDGLGSYQYIFYVLSIISGLCSFMWLGAHFVANRRQKYWRQLQ